MSFMCAYCLCLIIPATFCQNISSQRPGTYLLQPHSQHAIVHYVSTEKNHFYVTEAKAKLRTQSIHSKRLRYTEASIGSISWKEDCPQTDWRPGCLSDSCARHLCSPSIERNSQQQRRAEGKQRQGPEHKALTVQGTTFRRTQISAQAPLCWGVFREGKAMFFRDCLHQV